MFNLFRSRQKAMRYMLGGILIVVAVSMVITLFPVLDRAHDAANDAVIADIGGKLTTQDVMGQVQVMLRGQQIPPAMLQTYLPQMVDSDDPAARADL